MGIISLDSLICVFLMLHKVHFILEVLSPLLSHLAAKANFPVGGFIFLSLRVFFFNLQEVSQSHDFLECFPPEKCTHHTSKHNFMGFVDRKAPFGF